MIEKWNDMEYIFSLFGWNEKWKGKYNNLRLLYKSQKRLDWQTNIRIDTQKFLWANNIFYKKISMDYDDVECGWSWKD